MSNSAASHDSDGFQRRRFNDRARTIRVLEGGGQALPPMLESFEGERASIDEPMHGAVAVEQLQVWLALELSGGLATLT